MNLTDEQKAQIHKLLGANVEVTDETAVPMLLSFASHLSEEYQAAYNEVQELSAAAVIEPQVMELSATERTYIGRNLSLQIEHLAERNKWAPAYTQKVKALFGSDELIALSAAGDGDTASRGEQLLGLLSELPTRSLISTPTEQTLTLSREIPGQEGNGVNPLLARRDKVLAEMKGD